MLQVLFFILSGQIAEKESTISVLSPLDFVLNRLLPLFQEDTISSFLLSRKMRC